MTVRAIEVVAGEPAFSTYQDLIDAAEQKRQELPEALPIERLDVHVAPNDPLLGRPEHLRALVRFELSIDAKADFIDPIAGKLDEAGCAWFRIRYHECDHDGDHGDCDWSYTKDQGPVPEAV